MYNNEAHIQVQVPIYAMSSSSDVKKSKQETKTGQILYS